MPLPLLTTLLWGMAPVLGPPPSPQPQVAPQVAVAPPRAPESDAARLARLRSLVGSAEKALEAEDEDSAQARADEADVLTADWSPELLRSLTVQDLLQRLKEVQDQMSAAEPEAPGEAEPGLKAPEEVISISGEELRNELEKVRAAEHGATYDFPIDLNDKVLTWVSLFTTTKRGFMENALGRASVFMPMIRQVFAEEGVPQDLAYLAVIESGFRNEAKSRAKAVGMWQFIRSTGRIYGLTANAWIEERRDPVKSARAAARYLKRLYEISGDWYLAASGYNAGPLTLERAIQNIGTRNFWDLARSRWLRTETKNYVPELCAAILVGRNPGQYGLNIVPLAPYVYETVTVSAMTSLAVLARCAGTDSATLKALNPELLRGSTPPGSYTLRVPPGKALECMRQLARMPAGKRLNFQHYTIRRGDTLAKVAKRFKLAPDDLLDANDITVRQFRPGKRLLVPPAPSLALDSRDLAPKIERVKLLGDRPLEPLPVVPADPGPVGPSTTAAGAAGTAVAMDALPPAASNVGSPSPVTREPLPQEKVDPPVLTAAGSDPAHATYRAKPGDTLAKIARAQRIPLGQLMGLNPEAVKALHPGDTVRLPGSAPSSPSKRAEAAPRIHVVQRGETLASIGRKYGLEPKELKVWNRMKGDHLRAGQRLRLVPR
ncbi:LysM peptidoglycan-binding domain-containing protein [Geothrix fuzhouensis]|uniref:LysM peptidoglycan-binding domain-containing protein n=1 Tax=Geothrix fuzhouensis TaxID=2966451 RepID=UPI00214871E7|nr:LysM peptidoglycan-binding domain-containing protein [Geothrix fuzhouensis]